jgi:hypothetical protein
MKMLIVTFIIYIAITMLSICFPSIAVSLKEEHHVTVQAGQDLPHGPELAPIDPSFIGKHVQVTKSKGTGVIDREKFKPAV